MADEAGSSRIGTVEFDRDNKVYENRRVLYRLMREDLGVAEPLSRAGSFPGAQLEPGSPGGPDSRAKARGRSAPRTATHQEPEGIDDQVEVTDRRNLTDTVGALNPDRLRDRISETFSGGYMTLLAIIQGVHWQHLA
jgi:hypothetical protein